jgi:hypothetical protein
VGHPPPKPPAFPGCIGWSSGMTRGMHPGNASPLEAVARGCKGCRRRRGRTPFSMYACMHIYACIYTYMHAYIYVYMHACMHAYQWRLKPSPVCTLCRHATRRTCSASARPSRPAALALAMTGHCGLEIKVESHCI